MLSARVGGVGDVGGVVDVAGAGGAGGGHVWAPRYHARSTAVTHTVHPGELLP